MRSTLLIAESGGMPKYRTASCSTAMNSPVTWPNAINYPRIRSAEDYCICHCPVALGSPLGFLCDSMSNKFPEVLRG